MRYSGYAVMAGVLALAALSPAGAQERPMLVEYLPVAARSSDEIPGTEAQALGPILGDSGVLALRIGHAAPGPVIQARALSIVLPGSDETLTFDDLIVEALDSGYALYSGDRQSPTSTTLVVMGEDVMGTIRHDGAMYVVQPLGDGVTAVYLYDTAQLRKPPELKPDFVIPDADSGESRLAPQRAPAARDSRDRIDVLVVYSNSVRRGAGNVDTFIAQLVLRTNLAYRNSGITTSVRVVHSYETPYTPVAESGRDMGTDLDRLRIRADGHLDEMFARREQYGADVVILLTRNARAESGYCGGGKAYLGFPTRGNAAEWAFGVSATGKAACIGYDATTFAHEIGHIQGAVHNPEQERLDGNDPNSIPYAYGHGFCNAARSWRTVMSYNTDSVCEAEIEHFSSPVVLYRGSPTGDHQLRNAARVINETAIHVANYRQSKLQQSDTHTLPFVPPASSATQQGFVRVINHSDRAGEVRITAIDDTGRRFGPVTLPVPAKATPYFFSRELERGGRGLSAGVGDGEGNWRLALQSDLDIEPTAYIRTADGFLTSMHDVVRCEAGRCAVPFFNPASNTDKVSWLRVVNTSGTGTEVVITARDEAGAPAPGGQVRFTLSGGAAKMLSAQQLEAGDPAAFSGRLGDGYRKWQLTVTAGRPIEVMSLLLLTRTGHMANLSTSPSGSDTDTTEPVAGPDLVVRSPSVNDSSLSPGQSFRLSATVRNQGTGRSAATTLRYYRSSDATISTSDARVGMDPVGGLAASGTSPESISLTAPSSAGTYYYGACVDAVAGEPEIANNCSSAVRVTVTAPSRTKASYCNSGSSLWGAIATGWKGQSCTDGFGWGYSYDFSDRSSAISRAESECRSRGWRNCIWTVVFDRCGAIAYGESTSDCNLFGGYGATRTAAEQNALSACRAEYPDCRIPVDTSSGAEAPPPAEAQSGSGIADSPFGASNPDARPEPTASRRRDGG